MSLESNTIEEVSNSQEMMIEQSPEQNELLVNKESQLVDPVVLEQQWNVFAQAKESEMEETNKLRAELGLQPTNELPLYLSRKEQELKILDERINPEKSPVQQEGEYIDFEEIEKEKGVVQEKLQSLYKEIEALPREEYLYVSTHGIRITGELFSSSIFGVMQPNIAKRLFSFHEQHQVVDDEVIEAFIEIVEPEIQKEIDSQPALLEDKPEQKMIEGKEQLAIEDTPSMKEIPEVVNSN